MFAAMRSPAEPALVKFAMVISQKLNLNDQGARVRGDPVRELVLDCELAIDHRHHLSLIVSRVFAGGVSPVELGLYRLIFRPQFGPSSCRAPSAKGSGAVKCRSVSVFARCSHDANHWGPSPAIGLAPGA